MTKTYTHRSLTAVLALLTGAAAFTVLPRTADAKDAKVANIVLLAKFDNVLAGWMDAQAVYWRREQYADIASIAGSKKWEAKSTLINAELYVEHAKVALIVDDNPKQARDDLGHAKALADKAAKGADKAMASKINDVTGSIDSVKGELPKSPAAAPAETLKSTQDLTGVFASLKEIVEKG